MIFAANVQAADSFHAGGGRADGQDDQHNVDRGRRREDAENYS